MFEIRNNNGEGWTVYCPMIRRYLTTEGEWRSKRKMEDLKTESLSIGRRLKFDSLKEAATALAESTEEGLGVSGGEPVRIPTGERLVEVEKMVREEAEELKSKLLPVHLDLWAYGYVAGLEWVLDAIENARRSQG